MARASIVTETGKLLDILVAETVLMKAALEAKKTYLDSVGSHGYQEDLQNDLRDCILAVRRRTAEVAIYPSYAQYQTETATVVGTITGSGNVSTVLTAAGMTGSPITTAVAVVNTDTPTITAGKIRAALNAVTNITNFFTIGGTGADVVLTAKTAADNDTTMNLALDTGTATGLTAAPTSANTVAGRRP